MSTSPLNRSVLVVATVSLIVVAHARAQSGAGPRDGTVRGQVVDDRGQPLAGCRVSIGGFLGEGDQLHLLALPVSTRTNAQGHYEITGVPPGYWYVQVQQDVLLAGAVTTDVPDYPLSYFPGVTEARLARSVRVVAGATVDHIDVVVPRIPVFEMALRLSPLEQVTSRQVELFLDASAAGKPRAIPARAIEPGGIARFRRLRPGRYFVWARARTPTNILAAWRTIDIDDRSVELDLPLSATGRVAGRVVSADLPALSGARVVAVLVDGEREIDPRMPDSVEIEADGRFTIDGLFGDRRLRLIGLPEGWDIRAVRLNGRDMPVSISIATGTSVDGIELVVAR